MNKVKARDSAKTKLAGAPHVAAHGQASSWFVPPLVVPAFLASLLVAYVIYQAYV